MGDFLSYRIPNQSSVKKNGSFVKVDSFESVTGFVLASFDKSDRFLFVESNEESQFHYNKDKPHVDTKESYLENANVILEPLINGGLDKAILSRIECTSFSSDPKSFFNALCVKYPNAFVYLISSELFGTWIGATPEVLLSGESSVFFTYALAGTKASGESVEWTMKEYLEQQYVADFIQNILVSAGVQMLESTEVKTVNVGPVEHLRTDFSFRTEDSNRINIVENLHPTPAVSGTPREKSIELIHSVEAHKRSLYAGYIGPVESNINLFVNLRCAQLFEDECYLYLGGGFTKDSVPEKEWIETENKAKTLLNVIENL